MSEIMKLLVCDRRRPISSRRPPAHPDQPACIGKILYVASLTVTRWRLMTTARNRLNKADTVTIPPSRCASPLSVYFR
jgi:hypothetical protein